MKAESFDVVMHAIAKGESADRVVLIALQEFRKIQKQRWGLDNEIDTVS